MNDGSADQGGRIVLDQLAVRTVLETYFAALDLRDRHALIGCFTADAALEYRDGAVRMSGGDAFVDWVFDVLGAFAWTSHAMCNALITVDADGDGAVASCLAVVHLVDAEGGQVIVRGVRYDDRLLKTAGQWRIASRRHLPQWQYRVPRDRQLWSN